MRAETGKMTFGDDWGGVFIRGDCAVMTAFLLEEYLRKHPPGPDEAITFGPVLGLADLLASADERLKKPTQQMKPFEDCKK